MRNDDDNDEDENSPQYIWYFSSLIPYLTCTLPDLHMSFDSYDDASFRLQCQLRRYLFLGQLRVRLEKSIWIRPCT